MKIFKKWFIVKLLMVSCLFFSAQAHAFYGINPSITNDSKNIEGSIFLNLSTIDYDQEGGDNFEIERKIIGGNLAFSLSNKVDVFVTAGYIFDAEVENNSAFDSDGGVHAGGGIRANVYKQGKLSINVYGQFDYLIFDKFSANSTEIEMSGFDITGGGIFKYSLTRVVSLWGGVEIIPFDDYEQEDSGNNKYDTERADVLGIRLGANFGVESWTLRVELAFAGEQSLLFSGSTRF
jgi:hypothetical protein